MSEIISQIVNQITSQNKIYKGIWNEPRSQLIVSLRGDLEEIRDQFVKLVLYPFDLIEICPTSFDVLALQEMIKKPWILCYKKEPFQTQQEYLQDLQKLIPLNPTYIDIDYEDFEYVSLNLPFQGKWIISYHDFSNTSHTIQSLDQLYEQLRFPKATLIKIALSPTSPANALSLFFRARQIQEKDRKLLFVCMGEKYSWTRILSSKWNVGATYCSIKGHERYGQLSINELIETYSFFKNQSKTKIYALLGNPTQQSLSHITHNQIFRNLGLDALYCKIPVTEDEVADFLELSKTRFSGFSITTPLKSAIVPREIINTIYSDHFHFSFANTDTSSALTLIQQKNISPYEAIVILGTGSMAQALGRTLYSAGWKNLTLLSRTPHAQKPEELSIIDYATWTLLPDEAIGLVINTTPSGGTLPEKVMEKIFQSSPLFFELNYNPSLTQLVEKALQKECDIIWGIELFALQAALQMGLWFHFNRDEQESIRSKILEICTKLLPLQKKLITKVEKLPR